MSNTRISSPAATGGAGPSFEHHVAAYWMAQLLVRGIPPILIGCVVREVHFQTERLGWSTDDFLVECACASRETRRLAGQVKRSFTVSAVDEDCRKAIVDFWSDFKKGDPFRPDDDRFVLVTQRGTNVLLEHFSGLLDCARASRDASDFEARLRTEGFVSRTVSRYCGEIQKIVGDLEGKPLTAADLWPFFRVVHLLSLDLHTATRQAEALIKTLLAHSVRDGDAVAGADATWNALVTFAGFAIPEARSLRRDGLPEELQLRHSSVSGNEQKILRAAREHSELIVRGIRSNLGQGFQLARAALTQRILTELDSAQVVLVSGPAGSGKSVIGKQAVSLLSSAHFTFAFRAEEFAQAHLDGTLHAAQIPTNGATLAAILGAQQKRVVVVESIERLLEKPTRDAFADLMTLASSDGSMGVILTCRDYSLDQVRASFLQSTGITYSVVIVPGLEDAELAEVEQAFPSLAYPLKNPRLRGLLRNPYFLDKALEISWADDRLPENEREFRALFWHQIVRADQRVSAGTARERERIFQEIAVRRARALRPYAPLSDLSPEIVAALKHDALITSPEDNPLLVATAHDVLEDWAILHWIEEHYREAEESLEDLAAAIGGHPAIRRAYRNWLSELIDRNPGDADRLFVAAVTTPEISPQFRDDTLASLLKAPSSPEFLMRHEGRLLAGDSALLRQIVRLLRVACMKLPLWVAGQKNLEITSSVPDGPAWPTLLRLVFHHLARFASDDRLLLLGLVEDAVGGVTWWAPDVPGAEHIAGIAHSLVPHFDNYRSEKLLNRVLKVIAKIPKGDPVRFEALLRGSPPADGETRSRITDDFQEIILAGLEGLPGARDLPDAVLSIASDYLLAPEEEERRHRYVGPPMGVESCFGIKEERSFDSFPASGAHGPWIHLLRHHPIRALEFVIRVFNHSARAYAGARCERPLEPAWEVELTFADGTSGKQWGNPRLWNMYRGFSVSPYVLQSILMALESWLLEYAKSYPSQVDSILLNILRRSESASLAAVVASVATAHPGISGEALLVLLSARDYVTLDLRRSAAERQAGVLSGVLLGPRAPEHRIYEAERKVADGLPHRGYSLEDAAMSLQKGECVSRVHAILDRHRAALPSVENQTDEDRRWRLALHRTDLRKYTVSEIQIPPRATGAEGEFAEEEAPGRFLRFDPKEPDPDVKEMVDQNAIRMASFETQSRLFNWAYGTFTGRNSESYDPAVWHPLLSEAMQALPGAEEVAFEPTRPGPGILAAVCIRDHWDEMSAVQVDWCIERVCEEVMAGASEWNSVTRMQRYDMAADRASAWVLSLLPGKPLTELQRSAVEQAFAAALTHPNNEVRWHAVWGIAQNVSSGDRALARSCVNALAMEATLIQAGWHAHDGGPFGERVRRVGDVEAAAANAVRSLFWRTHGIPPDAYEGLDLDDWSGAQAFAQILTILSNDPENPVATSTFVRAAQTLVKWWDESRHGDRNRGHRDRSHDSESAVSDRIQKFVMGASYESAKRVLDPILAAIESYPNEIHRILQGLTAIEDSAPNTPHYWRLWELFAERVKRASWVSSLEDERPWGREMLSAIFLTSWWKDNVRHWRSLDGHAHHIHDLFDALPRSWIVLDSYIRFLYHVGEMSLPRAFVHIASALKAGEAKAMLADSNTVFMLVVLLQRHVYGKPLEVKRDATVRNAVLYLLDALVEAGSPAAYRMRDDFVTPVA